MDKNQTYWGNSPPMKGVLTPEASPHPRGIMLWTILYNVGDTYNWIITLIAIPFLTRGVFFSHALYRTQCSPNKIVLELVS